MADFEVLGRLGSGAYGVVHKVLRKVDGREYVIKTVSMADMTDKAQAEAVNEVALLAKMRSRYVVQYCDSFVEQQSLHIVMEYCNRGDLKALLKKAKARGSPALPERITWGVFLQVALGLYDLHRARVLHRDLKTANIFLTKNPDTEALEVKIGDLGVAKLLETTMAFAQTIVGTPYYLSPELCSDQPYGDKSDIWALGVVLYECCTLQMPFEASNQCALILKIIEGKFTPVQPTHVSPILCKLVNWLLTREPMQRPSVSDILSERTIREKLYEHGFELPSALQYHEVLCVLQPEDRISQEAPAKIVQRNKHAKSLPVTASASPPTWRKQPMESTKRPDSGRRPDSKQTIRGTRVRPGQSGKRDVSSRALHRYQVQPPLAPSLPSGVPAQASKYSVRSGGGNGRQNVVDSEILDGNDSDGTASTQDGDSDCNSQADTITGIEQVAAAPTRVALKWSVSDGSVQEHVEPVVAHSLHQLAVDALESDTTFEPSTLSEEEGNGYEFDAPQSMDECYEAFLETLDEQKLSDNRLVSKQAAHAQARSNSVEQRHEWGYVTEASSEARVQELASLLANAKAELQRKLGADLYNRLYAVCKYYMTVESPLPSESEQRGSHVDSFEDGRESCEYSDQQNEVPMLQSEFELLEEIASQLPSREDAQETFQAMKRVLAFETGVSELSEGFSLRAHLTA